ncbi:HD domain-containing protein [Desulfatiglans anilini]|uniref:HD domain-containing protein n=1 Tax=Desulfatiglans anilini TaxID=90728 RepID=UPI00041DAD2D|nr:HD domain-containing protein [Desulfatiglans anilini]
MIPSYETCLEAWDQHRMLDNIRAHSLIVARVAHFLAETLLAQGIPVSVAKTTAGALMHDIAKTPSLQSGEDHSELGRRICLQHHFDEIADIVAEHVRLRSFDLNGVYSEKELVYYADKRVNHDRIVSLDRRLDYIIERYGAGDPDRCSAIRLNFGRCRLIEGKIFSKLAFGPEALKHHVLKGPEEPVFTTS